MSDENAAMQVEQAAPRFVASADQEVWVMERIRDAVNMVIAAREQSTVAANEFPLRYGVQGIIEGAAVEIIRTLGGEPEYTNLRNPFDGVPDGRHAKCYFTGPAVNRRV